MRRCLLLRQLVCFATLCLALTGCSLSPRTFQTLSQEQRLAQLDVQELFAVHPDGDLIAYVNNGLHLLRLSTSEHHQLTYESPYRLLWSADGEKLVAAFQEAEKTRLVMITDDVNHRPQVFIDQHLGALAWLDDKRLLALAEAVTEDDENRTISTELLTWDGGWAVKAQPLYSYTYPLPAEISFRRQEQFVDRFVPPDRFLPPYRYNNEDYRLSKRVPVATPLWYWPGYWHEYPQENPVVPEFVLKHTLSVSPLQDEIVYNRYIGPPQTGGSMEIVLRDLHTGREQVLSHVDARRPRAFFSTDGEAVLLPRGGKQVVLYNPWTKQTLKEWDGYGVALLKAPKRELYLIDGRLIADGHLQLSLPFAAQGQFSADASRLFVAWHGGLYLFDDYQVPPAMAYGEIEKVKLRRIRLQRSKGEISQHQYEKLKNNILNR